MKLPRVNKKTTSKKANFWSNTVFSLYFKIRAKKFTPQNHSLYFLFWRDQNHYSKVASKIMKMCEQIFKKKTAPQYNSNSLNCKKHYVPNNSRYRFAAIKNWTSLVTFALHRSFCDLKLINFKSKLKAIQFSEKPRMINIWLPK